MSSSECSESAARPRRGPVPEELRFQTPTKLNEHLRVPAGNRIARASTTSNLTALHTGEINIIPFDGEGQN